MALIPFSTNSYTNDTHFEVDDEDVEKVQQHTWRLHKITKSNRYYVTTNYKGKSVRLHRLILSVTDPKIQVDHHNGNIFDNKKSNLRLCSNKENNRNKPKPKRKINCSSKYKGVSLDKRNKKNPWKTQIQVDGKQINLGHFNSEIEAAKVYDRKAIELFGEFSNTNFPKSDYV